MKDYLNYEPEDFALDDYFIRWVSCTELKTETFWQDWLETYPFKRQDVETARQLVLLGQQLPSPEINESEIKAMKESVFNRIDVIERQFLVRKSVFWKRYLPVAASIAAAVMVLGWAWSKKRSEPKTVYVSHVKEAAEKYDLVEVENRSKEARLINLPDGSSVILKKGSKLAYPNYFKKEIREIYLTGEAFFEISKDPRRPFYVYANEIVTKVLGTSFTIKAYPEDREIMVSVKTGKVSVYKSATSEAEQQLTSTELGGIVLVPNQSVVFEKENASLVKKVLEIPVEAIATEIHQMSFEYDETPVDEIFRQLAEAYKITIVYDKSVIGKCPVTASLTDEPLYEKLSLVCRAVRAHYEIMNGEIIISGKGCE
jgi:transmembrane sensor